MSFTETEILEQLDLAFRGIPGSYYPEGGPGDIRYNFFLDLEDGYLEVAKSRIHLYADAENWALVFERSGYHNRSLSAEIELDYVGNCIQYAVSEFPERTYITNVRNIVLITRDEFGKIVNQEGEGLETFELIAPDVKAVEVRGKPVPFSNHHLACERSGIAVRAYNNPLKLIGFGDLIRYFNETSPAVIEATEEDIKQHIPACLPKLITIDEFHSGSMQDTENLPSSHETYKLIAKVLVTKDAANWQPGLPPNNHWTNWESGFL